MPIADRFRLDGQVAVITGGSRGIGRAVALGFAEQGADVVVAARDLARCEAVAAEVADRGARGLGVACDVAREEQVHALFDRVAQARGPASIFVHAAGHALGHAAKDAQPSELRAMMDVHLCAAVVGAQRAAAQMEQRGGGAILLVTSVFGLGGVSHTLAYGTAKAALAHAVKVFAVEWARRGVRVNGLAPGLVDTAMTADLSAAARDALVRRVPMQRAASPEEMASCALFLCSPAASYVTGAILVADGGERAR